MEFLEVFRNGLSESQRDALFCVTELLDAMHDDVLWTEQAVRDDGEWGRVRLAANAAIASLGTSQPTVVDRSLADEVNSWKWQLHEMIEAVVDPCSLLEFVRALVRDRRISMHVEAETPSSSYGPLALGWENVTVDRFLDAAGSWARSTKFGETQGLSPANPWRQFAAFLYCGKIYESVRDDGEWGRVRSAANAAIASLGTSQPRRLHEMIEAVVDPCSLLEFVRALVRDRRISMHVEAETPSSSYGPEALGWENVTVDRFLEAAGSWARSTTFGETQGLSPANPWRQFAAFLYCGKIYE